MTAFATFVFGWSIIPAVREYRLGFVDRSAHWSALALISLGVAAYGLAQ